MVKKVFNEIGRVGLFRGEAKRCTPSPESPPPPPPPNPEFNHYFLGSHDRIRIRVQQENVVMFIYVSNI